MGVSNYAGKGATVGVQAGTVKGVVIVNGVVTSVGEASGDGDVVNVAADGATVGVQCGAVLGDEEGE